MRFASIGSGSEGNGLIVEAGTTRVLIDCGFGVRDTRNDSRESASTRVADGDPGHARAQ
jgi:phosphoribosyl 1,2-cyclic phosphodiesterase